MLKLRLFLSSIGIGLCVLVAACTTRSANRNIVVADIYQDKFVLFGSSKLQVVGMDGLGNAYYDFPKDLAYQPDWSPDGKWIVASIGGRMAGSNSDLLFVSSDGNYRYQLVTSNQGESDPAWSPDGKMVVYSSYNDIYTIDVTCVLQKEKCQPLATHVAEGQSPNWSPDGTSITFFNNVSIFVVRVDGTYVPTQITSEEEQCTQPQWSPDGAHIIAICKDGLTLLTPDGHSIEALGVKGIQPSWFPDGSKIAFVSWEGDGLGDMLGWETCSADALFSINIDGSDLQRLTHGKNECILEYSWLPSVQINR